MKLDLTAFSAEDFQPLVGNTTTPKKEKYEGESVIIFHPVVDNSRAKMELSSTACTLLNINPEEITKENRIEVAITNPAEGIVVIQKGSGLNVGKNRRFTNVNYYNALVKLFKLDSTKESVLSLGETSTEGILYFTEYIAPTNSELSLDSSLADVVTEEGNQEVTTEPINNQEELVMTDNSSSNGMW